MRLAKVTSAGVRYFHKDHPGSSTLVTDPSGNLTDAMFYEPFGQPRETCRALTGNVAYTFTDQEWDAETGLYNYDARLYDAMMGRFLSADSVIPDYYNPQALDRYAYVLNNPLGLVDPDGHEYEDAVRVWNSFVTNPNSAKYGIPRQVRMFGKKIRYSMPFTQQFKNKLAFMDWGGTDVTQLSHEKLGQLYHQEVLENIGLATEVAGVAGGVAALRRGVGAKVTNAPKKGFRDMMSPEEAARYDKYWTKKAPTESTPYSTYRRYTPEGDIKQVTAYDKYGNRQTQFDLKDKYGRDPHRHDFKYDQNHQRPSYGARDQAHKPLDDIPDY